MEVSLEMSDLFFFCEEKVTFCLLECDMLFLLLFTKVTLLSW